MSKYTVQADMILTDIVRDMNKHRLKDLQPDYLRPAYQYTSLETGGIEDHDTCEER